MGKAQKTKIRPDRLEGEKYKIITAFREKLYLTLNRYKGKPFEVFVKIGKAGGDLALSYQVIGRLISICLRNGISVESIVKQLGGTSDRVVPTVPEAIARVLEGEETPVNK